MSDLSRPSSIAPVPAPRYHRKLAAILYADVAGYSRLIGVDEDGTTHALRRALTQVDAMVADHGGRVVHHAGDAVLAEFDTSLAALSCAAHLQRRFVTDNAQVASNRRLVFRIGINQSEVIVEDGNIYGDGVNIAARLEALAEPGGICISEVVKTTVGDTLPLQYQSMGERNLKNIASVVRVYRVRGEGFPFPTEATARRHDETAADVAGMRAPTVVVLPFENLSASADDEYFCDGLTETLTSELSKFRQLFIIAAHSAFTYKSMRVTAQDVGRELGVKYLLAGSVQRSPARTRVNAQLIETSTAHHLWADRFDATGADVFAIQDEIIQRIASVLAAKVDGRERQQVLRKDTPQLNAYESYLKGIHLFSQLDRKRLEEAERLFERAVRLDPDFARAWGYLAYTCTRSFILGWSGREVLGKALDFANRAVQLDADDYANFWDLAQVYLTMGDVDRAMHQWEKALQLNPNDADMLAEMSVASIYAGAPEKAIDLLGQAMRINPRFPDWYRWNLGWACFNARRYEQALAELERIDQPSKHVWLKIAAAHARLGDSEAARAALSRFLEMEPDGSIGNLRDRFPFKLDENREHWLESLAMAGLAP